MFIKKGAQSSILIPQLGVHPRKSIHVLGISCYSKNPGTKQVLQCSTPILGIMETFNTGTTIGTKKNKP